MRRELSAVFVLLCAVAALGESPSEPGVLHVMRPGSSERIPVTPALVQQRLEAAANRLAVHAPVPRIALFDLTYPADSAEYAALAGYGVVLISVASQDPSELPLARVYFEAEDSTDLVLISSVSSTAEESEFVSKVFGRYRLDAVYLFPMHLRHRSGRILIDFAANRSGFALADFPFAPDDLPDYEPTAPAPLDEALVELLQRELPNFVESPR